MTKDYLITTIGGGTGTYPVISSLQKLSTNIGAVVAMADSGGSTGRLRDEFGFPPVGDLRQSLTAMANPINQRWIQQLLIYRFKSGNSLVGHSLGNLIITALQDLTNSTTEALQIASSIFQLSGFVYPITDTPVDMIIHYEDGQIIVGEHLLDLNTAPKKVISKITFQPKAIASTKALERLEKSTTVVIGPGDLYASLHAVLVVPGVKQALKKVKNLVYLVNLFNNPSQTYQFKASDYIQNIEKVIDRSLNFILINNQQIDPKIIKRYHDLNHQLVEDNLENDKRVIRADIIYQETELSDSLKVVRHSSIKLEPHFKRIIGNKYL